MTTISKPSAGSEQICYICTISRTLSTAVTSAVRTRLGWLCPTCYSRSKDNARAPRKIDAWDVLPHHPMTVQPLPPLLRLMVERRLSGLPDSRWRATPEGGFKGVKGDRRSPRQRF